MMIIRKDREDDFFLARLVLYQHFIYSNTKYFYHSFFLSMNQIIL